MILIEASCGHSTTFKQFFGARKIIWSEWLFVQLIEEDQLNSFGALMIQSISAMQSL
jgi:hypothetical protein